MLFRRRWQQQVRNEDPGTKLINRIMMLGLVAFVAFSVLSEKKALQQTKTVWNVSAFNNISGKDGIMRLPENNMVELALEPEDVQKIKDMKLEKGQSLPVFKLKMTQEVITQPANQNLSKPTKSPEVETPKPQAAAPAPAKTNVTP